MGRSKKIGRKVCSCGRAALRSPVMTATESGSMVVMRKGQMRAAIRTRAIRACAIAAAVTLLIPVSSCRTPAGKPALPVVKAPAVSVSVQTWSGEGLSGRLLSTEHFDIISTLRDEPFEAALPGFLEAAYRRYAEIIPDDPESRGFSPRGDPRSGPRRVKPVVRRLTTYIFGTRWEWQRFARRRFSSRYEVYARIVSGGFAEGTTSVSFHRSRSSTLATLAHEGWHQYVAASVPGPMPAWLDEGFACYHEAVDFAGAEPRFTPQHNTFRINSLRDALQADRLLPLSEIIDTNAGDIITHGHAGIAQVYYAQVWALVTFLKHGDEGRYAAGLQLMLNHIADGSFHVRSGAARLTGNDGAAESAAHSVFRTYFSRSVEEITEPYREHLIRIADFRGGDASTSQ